MQPRELAALLADGAPHSGADLAARFGVTRAAVWKHIEELREAGLAIDAAAGQGYRLGQAFELLDAERLRAALPTPLCKRVGIDVHWEIESTNSTLLRAAGQGARDLQVLLAERQSGGRGRRGRAWASPLGNVYCSLLKRFDTGMAALSGLSLAVGVALARALHDVRAQGVGLKWPNDVLVRGAKLAGILVELGGEFLGPCHAVIGIGVNMTSPRGVHDQPVTDLLQVCEVVPSRTAFVAHLVARLVEALDQFTTLGFAGLREEYLALDVLQGRALNISDARGIRAGVGVGVDARGALCVRHGDHVVSYDSAEVTVRAA